MRLAVIGGGSVFTPELVEALARDAEAVGPMELRMVDVDEHRLEVVGGLSRRIVERFEAPIEIRDVASYEKAIDGADFVLVQFRQGGQDARIRDEKLGLKYHLPFTETISVCGVATYLRTYPVIERLAEMAQALAPNAWVMNFTNPAGQISETFSRLGCRKVVGVCNSSIGVRDFFAQFAGAEPSKIFMNWRGLNHLTFTDKVFYCGENILPQALESLNDFESVSPFPADLIRTLGVLPNGYLQYYYLSDTIASKLQQQPKVRSEVVKELEGTLLSRFTECSSVPDELTKRGGYGYSRLVAELIRGIVLDAGSIHYANVLNGSILPELPSDAFVEVPVLVKAEGITPIAVDPLPPFAVGLAVTMKQYERLLIEAARTRSYRLLMQSLLTHPLIPSYNVARPLAEDILEENREYMPAFS